MRAPLATLLLICALGLSALTPADAQAWTWGRFYGTGYAPTPVAPVSAIDRFTAVPSPAPAPGPSCYPGYQPNNFPAYQSDTFPAYKMQYPGYNPGTVYPMPLRPNHYAPGSHLYSGEFVRY
jgi:hypothetical protein